MIPSASKVWDDEQVAATDADSMARFNDPLQLVTVTPDNSNHLPSSKSKDKQPRTVKSSSSRTRFHQSAVVDVPFRYHNNGELTWDPTGHFCVSSTSPLTTKCDLRLTGDTLLRGKTGVSTTSAHVTYRYSNALTFQTGCSIGTAGKTGAAYAPANVKASVTVKTPTTKSSSTTQTTASPPSVITVSVAAPVQLASYKSTHLSISTRRNVISPLWTIALNGSCRFHDLTPSLATTLYCNSKHSWNVQVGVRSKQQKIYPTIRLATQFLLGNIKSTCQVLLNAPGIQWTLQFCKKQEKTKNKKNALSISLSRTQKDWLSWMFTWTVGDLTMRIPIFISWASGSPLAVSICTVYMSLVSKVILDAVAQVIQPQQQMEALDSNRAQGITSQEEQQKQQHKIQLLRQDAQQQQDLMKRLASVRKQQEEQKETGLVIEQAVYYTDHTRWDVTIPLQFWVTEDSTVELAEGSKRGMLGFYDITLEHSTQQAKKDDDSTKVVAETASDKQTKSWWSWCKDFWTMEEKQAKRSKDADSSISKEQDHDGSIARLFVRYRVNDTTFEITTRDEQALQLPSEMATIVAPYRIVLNY